jgi:hypothetical protein
MKKLRSIILVIKQLCIDWSAPEAPEKIKYARDISGLVAANAQTQTQTQIYTKQEHVLNACVQWKAPVDPTRMNTVKRWL